MRSGPHLVLFCMLMSPEDEQESLRSRRLRLKSQTAKPIENGYPSLAKLLSFITIVAGKSLCVPERRSA